MSKMREAAERKYGQPWATLDENIREDFESGYQAAIADVKTGGEKGWLCLTDESVCKYPQNWLNQEPLYKLPGDVVESTVEQPYVDPDAGKSAAQLRAKGRPYCPKCYTFGYSHRKDCLYRNDGMTKHVKEDV